MTRKRRRSVGKKNTRIERSAGGVVWCRAELLFSRYPAVASQHAPDSAMVLTILDSHDHWALPKGRLEAGESPEQAARRETHEETGLSALQLTTPLGSTEFWFEDKWEVKGQRVHKFVDYYLYELTEPQPVITSIEAHVQEHRWVPVTELAQVLSYPSLKSVVARTLELLSSPAPLGAANAE